MPNEFSQVEEYLKKSNRILILLHQSPDGDTISSSLALATYFRRIGKSVDLAVKDEVPQIFDFLMSEDEIKKDFLLGDYDLIFAVDCGDAIRTGFPVRLEKISKIKPLINIDHHFRNNLHKIAKLNIVDGSASAAAEIVYDLLISLGAKIDSKIATFILAGIYYDTGGFQHSNVTERTLKTVSECISLGGRISLVAKNISANKKTSGLRLWGIALKRMQLNANGVVFSYLTKKDLAAVGADSEEASGIVNLINTVPGSRMALLLIESPDGKIKASLRTEEEGVDVSKFARLFGGGGHRKAAGFTVEDSLESLTAKI
jgi:phosphoesterase RecJ-like protein